MTFEEVNILGNLINSTYGKTSSLAGDYSIKCDLAGDSMILKYTTIVYFASERSLRDQVTRTSEEAQSRLDEYLKSIKSDFKEIADRALKTKDIASGDNVELIQSTSNSPRKVAYYRLNHTLAVE
tara:strand:- start:53 stop:427 length:375 start_codon:yes stop_codon:yes gene_type:complete